MGTTFIKHFSPILADAGLESLDISSLTGLSVGSTGTVRNLTVSNLFTGAATFRGVSTIASGDTFSVVSPATGANSGAGIFLSLGRQGFTLVASHNDMVVTPNSGVTGVSFMIVANKATVEPQAVSYFIVN